MIPSFPSRGKQLIESPFVWLKEKAKMDRERTGVPSNLWYVKGKYYDLTKFINLHPGGDYFLKLTQGQDITELYYSHHLNLEKCQNILDKYYVQDATKIQQYFDFDNDGFYMTLHKKVAQHNNIKTRSFSMNLTVLTTIFSFLLSFLLTCIYQSYIWAFICGYVLFVCMGLGHNFLHKGPREPLRYFTDLQFFSHYHWSITHCISHHSYPNSNIDYEITSMEPYYISTKSRLPNNRFIKYYLNIFFCFVSLLEMISKFWQTIKQEEKLRKEYLIPFLEYFIMYFIINDAYISFKLFMTMQIFASFLTLKYSTLPHRTNLVYTDGSNIKPSRDFGIYIMQSATDHDTWLKFPFNMFIFQGFNDHCLHHMFPTVDESRIPELHQYLDETLKQFNLQQVYKIYSIIDLYKAHNKHIM